MAIVEANKTATGGGFVINETPDVAPEKMFETILSKYQGKVVVVDFWATCVVPALVPWKPLNHLKSPLS